MKTRKIGKREALINIIDQHEALVKEFINYKTSVCSMAVQTEDKKELEELEQQYNEKFQEFTTKERELSEKIWEARRELKKPSKKVEEKLHDHYEIREKYGLTVRSRIMKVLKFLAPEAMKALSAFIESRKKREKRYENMAEEVK